MNYISNWFHFYDTTESFEVHRKQGLISPDSICFLHETSQIYTQGAFFGICKERYEKLEKLVLEHDAKIKDILGIEGPSVGDGVVNNIADIVNFLDGFTDQENLKNFIRVTKEALENQINYVYRALLDKITTLEDNIRNDSESLHSMLDAIDSRIDAVDIRLNNHDTSITDINTTIALHIREYTLLKVNYENFKSYATTKFNAIDGSIESLTTAYNTLSQYFAELDKKFDSVENEVAGIESLIEEAKRLARELESRFEDTLAALEQFKRDINADMERFKELAGNPGGFAPLDGDVKIPSEYLPSYVDDVLEYPTFAAFPVIGESGKIYVALDDNLTYRWSGSTYVEISKSLALGETASTAYPGNKGKKNADDIVRHIADKTNPHNVTKAQLGLNRVDNTADVDKPVSAATQAALDTKVDKVTGKDLSTNDFTNEYKAKVDGGMSYVKRTYSQLAGYTPDNIGDVVYVTDLNEYMYWTGTEWREYGITGDEVNTLLAGKADAADLIDVVEAKNVVDQVTLPEFTTLTREDLKKDLFIDLWDTACWPNTEKEPYGRYNPSTGFFELNGITDISYDEALKIYQYSYNPGILTSNNMYNILPELRTILPLRYPNGYSDLDYVFTNATSLEVIGKGIGFNAMYANSYNYTFFNCEKLRLIEPKIHISLNTNTHNMFNRCYSLTYVNFSNLQSDVSLVDSPNLSFECVKGIASAANGNSYITVTVHPLIYEKLVDEADTQWHPLLSMAANRRITFATVLDEEDNDY